MIVAFQNMLKISLFLSFEDNHLLLFWFPRVQKYLVADILRLDDRSTRHCFVKRWGMSLIDVDKLLMTDECNYDQPLVRHQSVGLQKCWMKPVLVLAPSQPTAHCFALAYSNITLAHKLLSKRENACSLTEERLVTMHTQRLQVSFSCNFRMIFPIKPVWSSFACLFSLTLQLEIIQTKLLPRAMLIQLSDVHMFRTLTRGFLATLLKENKVFPNYIVCYEHQNWFSIPCGEVPRWSQSS